ncbi:type 4a pilus biogenesis protein PilO [Malonomonas rubra]|uniref:type 4a pilus biogenesis protein PilO n=1 Tax=Malonomonas rubra TaxID=57040 RepID=UPI0026EF482F|nr:type 4a pilus biogenesis protein PilO [Malonomonas rubra]
MNPRVEWVLKRPKYQRVLMLVGLVVALMGLYGWALVLPGIERLSELTQESANLQVKIDADSRVAANLPRYKAEYEKLLSKLDEALSELPNGKEIPALLTSISSTAKTSGLDVLTFKPGAEVPKGFYAEVPVSLKLEGSFHELANFFYKIGTLPRIVNIGDVKIGLIKSKKGDSSKNNLSVDCMAITFRFIEGATGNTGAAPKKGSAK